MVSKEAIVANEKGLRARSATEVAKKSVCYKSKISINFNGRKANAKSIMNIISLGIFNKAKITVEASGDDEELAVEELVKLVQVV